MFRVVDVLLIKLVNFSQKLLDIDIRFRYSYTGAGILLITHIFMDIILILDIHLRLLVLKKHRFLKLYLS